MTSSIKTSFSTELREIFLRPEERVCLLVVKEPDSLLDQEITSQHIPYWAELWPSALALATYLREFPFRGEKVLELGCGMGLTTIALSRAGACAVAIDYDLDATYFTHSNLLANNETAVVLRMDWNTLGFSTTFPYIVGADILYDRSELPKLTKLFSHYLEQGGQVILAEPGREIARVFFQTLSLSGLEIVRQIKTPIDKVSIWHLSKKHGF